MQQRLRVRGGKALMSIPPQESSFYKSASYVRVLVQSTCFCSGDAPTASRFFPEPRARNHSTLCWFAFRSLSRERAQERRSRSLFWSILRQLPWFLWQTTSIALIVFLLFFSFLFFLRLVPCTFSGAAQFVAVFRILVFFFDIIIVDRWEGEKQVCHDELRIGGMMRRWRRSNYCISAVPSCGWIWSCRRDGGSRAERGAWRGCCICLLREENAYRWWSTWLVRRIIRFLCSIRHVQFASESIQRETIRCSRVWHPSSHHLHQLLADPVCKLCSSVWRFLLRFKSGECEMSRIQHTTLASFSTTRRRW